MNLDLRPRRRPCGAAILIAALVAASACRAPADDEVVTLTDGTRLRGAVSFSGDALLVRTGERDVHLSPALVAARERAPGSRDSAPEYRFHEPALKAPKKGTLALVVEKFEWRGSFAVDGRAPASCVDPKLGAIAFDVVVHRITPERVFVEAVEYRWSTAYAARTMAPLVVSLVSGAVDGADPRSVRKAVRFFREFGDADAAMRWLERWAELAPGDGELEAEKTQIAVGRFLAAAEEFETLRAAGDEERALLCADRVEISPEVEKILAERVRLFREQSAALALRKEAVSAVMAEFRTVDPAPPAPSGAQAERIRSLQGRVDGPIESAWLPALAGDWADALVRDPAEKLPAASVGRAVALAGQVAAFFSQPKPVGARELSRALEQSPIPSPWKWEIFRRAYRYEEPAARSGFQRFEYEHPRLKKRFHYFVQIPAGYRPDTPCAVLLTLHGQHSSAEHTVGWWGELAERHGFLLISPEYIYGRRYGYECSETEHHAVLGALWHASGWLNVDLDRVFLQGSSQGGHAAWDIGGAHADRFAGVIPIIGASLAPRKLANLTHTGLYCVDGSEDGGSPVLNRKAIQVLARLRADARYVEFPGRAHESFSEEYESLFRWMRDRRSPPAPTEARLHVHCRGNAGRGFIEIAGFARQPPATNLAQADIASVEARIDRAANAVSAESKGVTQLRIRISPLQFDLDRPVRVTVNGKGVHEAVVRPSWERALEDAHSRRDRRGLYLGEIVVPAR